MNFHKDKQLQELYKILAKDNNSWSQGEQRHIQAYMQLKNGTLSTPYCLLFCLSFCSTPVVEIAAAAYRGNSQLSIQIGNRNRAQSI